LFQSIPWPEFTEFSSARKDFFWGFSFFLGKFYGGRKLGRISPPGRRRRGHPAILLVFRAMENLLQKLLAKREKSSDVAWNGD
jgi:hypothetical protein